MRCFANAANTNTAKKHYCLFTLCLGFIKNNKYVEYFWKNVRQMDEIKLCHINWIIQLWSYYSSLSPWLKKSINHRSLQVQQCVTRQQDPKHSNKSTANELKDKKILYHNYVRCGSMTWRKLFHYNKNKFMFWTEFSTYILCLYVWHKTHTHTLWMVT